MISFGSETGIELPGEGAGILYNPEDMSKLDVATMSIGQGIAVTPLQWYVPLVLFLMGVL